jgi:hypothetical protein
MGSRRSAAMTSCITKQPAGGLDSTKTRSFRYGVADQFLADAVAWDERVSSNG